jgi:hypothetical protein
MIIILLFPLGHISNIMEAGRGEINQGVKGAGYTTKKSRCWYPSFDTFISFQGIFLLVTQCLFIKSHMY